MRILHVIPLLWSGAGNVVTRLVLDQAEQHDVRIVTAGQSRGERDWTSYRERLVEAGIDHERVDFFDRDPAVHWQAIEKFTALVKTWHPDVVHAHAGVAACGAAVARDRAAVSFRLVAHCYNWRPGRPTWMNSMDLWGFGRADRVICSAHAYRRRLLGAGMSPAQVAYIPWGLPIADIDRECADVPRRAGDAEKRIRTIGCVARLEPRKQQLELVRAFARCQQGDASLRLDLVGPPGQSEYATRVAECIRGEGLESVVAMPGRIQHVYRRMAGWDAFVSLSCDEGQGLAVLEAMAVGTPVLALASAGIEDFLEDRVNGFRLPDVSPHSVGAALRAVLSEHPSHLATIVSRARRLVEERYSWATTVRRLEVVYR